METKYVEAVECTCYLVNCITEKIMLITNERLGFPMIYSRFALQTA